jgi:hypothetical protein
MHLYGRQTTKQASEPSKMIKGKKEPASKREAYESMRAASSQTSELAGSKQKAVSSQEQPARRRQQVPAASKHYATASSK